MEENEIKYEVTEFQGKPVTPGLMNAPAQVVPAAEMTSTERMLKTIDAAITSGAEPATLERLLDMAERINANQARDEFFQAFYAARKAMPVIRARGRNETTRSDYARLDDIQGVIVPIYSEHGFSMMFWSEASPVEHHRRIFAKVAHVAGHTEEYHTDLPLDMHGMKGNQNKTAVHASGSADKYGQRYLTTMIWNLRVSNDPLDDDGTGAGADEVITEKQAANLKALMEEVNADADAFIEYFQVSKIEHLPAPKLQKAIKMLERKRQS